MYIVIYVPISFYKYASNILKTEWMPVQSMYILKITCFFFFIHNPLGFSPAS